MKKLLVLITVLTLALSAASCGAGGSSAENAAGAGTSAEEPAEPEPSDADVHWEYTYAGVEHPYLEAISDYLCRYNEKNPEQKDGMIPCITVLQVDNDDESDVKIWGVFDVSNYTLTDGTLVEENTARLAGLFHLSREADGSYAVTEGEFLKNDDPDAIDAMTEGYDLAREGLHHITVTEETRRWYLSQFVKAEGLDAVQYRPLGGDPLPLAYEAQPSPAWVADLPEAAETGSLIVVDITVGSNAVLTMHEKQADGTWMQTVDEAAFIGKNGPGKEKEGDLKTPLGTFGFNAALGIHDDPGCAIPYTKVDDTYYWDADSDSDRYNTLVTTNEYTDFNKDESEHIIDFKNAYQYILNTTYNDDGTPMKGSAIFLHCYREERTYTGGCISIPFEQMEYVMKHVQPDSRIIIRMADE